MSWGQGAGESVGRRPRWGRSAQGPRKRCAEPTAETPVATASVAAAPIATEALAQVLDLEKTELLIFLTPRVVKESVTAVR